ncbi:MAG: hypothetical protein IKR73_09050, partial [Oscillospiraceae bacterium]|nr:hypothetical protein [Oscillospiraceae bacterium]
QTKSVWQSCYNDDGLSKTVIANSLWLSDKLSVKRGAVDRLADSYYAYVYRGKIGTDGFDKAMQKFFSDGTDGLLDDSISGIKTKKTDAMVLASTLSFSGKWTSPFPKSGTEKAVFHGASGDTKCDFLNGRRDMSYWSGDNFAYIELPFEENCYMRLILPDEGTSPADLINDSSFMGKMMGTKKNDTSRSGHISVTYSVPKFDVMSDTDLVEGMKELGIKDIFGSEADFSAVTTDKGISLSQAKQSVRVQIDEEGCNASAITAMIACGAAMPQDSAEIVFDRPFIFQIMTEKGLPLFIGIVNEP